MKTNVREQSLNIESRRNSPLAAVTRLWKHITSLYSFGHLTTMATSNDLPSPGSQFLQTDDAFDDELRQADDEDWPTLISSADPGEDSTMYSRVLNS